MPKIQQVKGRFFISIPRDVIDAKKWIKGTRLLIRFNERGNPELEEIQ